jgi:hypothetical protein
MSKQRYINTKIWEDAWFSSLDQIEQLVFIYFLTNPTTNIIGAYELSKGTISRAVGLETLTLDTILKRFEKDKKVYYLDGWVVIPNFIKHQNYNSPKIKVGIDEEMKSIPEEVKKLIPYIYPIDTISHSNTNTNIIKFNILGADIIKKFEDIDPKNKKYYGNKSQRASCDFLLDEYGLDKVFKVIDIIKRKRGTPYFPSITSPYELQQKWTKVGEALKREKGNEHPNL